MAGSGGNTFDPVPIPPEVIAFLNQASEVVGFQASEDFNINTWCEFSDLEIASPIEQLLYAALKAARQVTRLPEADVHRINGVDFPFGLGIDPQVTIGDYRVDFMVYYRHWPIKGVQQEKTVLVECDSQQWHERTEQERRYEKRRDRDLLAQGYRVLHFTGKEIVEDPYLVASEILAAVDETTTKEGVYESVQDYLVNMLNG